jgi:hypothetical protein
MSATRSIDRHVMNCKISSPSTRYGSFTALDRSAKASTAIKPVINSDETVAAIVFALELSFHDRRP